jgi:hypothetical protein
VPTKKESALDLYRLIEWNHKYDGENLKRAMDFIREFKHKVDTCRLCRRSFEPCRGRLALERTFRMTGADDFHPVAGPSVLAAPSPIYRTPFIDGI